MANIRIGISGWRYTPWRGVFYPKDLPQRAELHYASRVMSTIEINGSFYSLQRPESYARWCADTPDDFMFTVKGPRYITHMRRLREVEEPLANFLAWASSTSVKNSGQSFGSFHPILNTSGRALRRFSHCFHKIQMPRRASPASARRRS